MPRIDPLQLINCLQVLLSPTGGILSLNEVARVVSLMTKFSKKLVSKCVYILILKSTEGTLLDAFMNAGGWTLVQLWLHDAMFSMNWALVKELLELLLATPVDVERLKSNNIPKLVKTLSKREDLTDIPELSAKLVQQWLKIVKGETNSEQRPPVSETTVITVVSGEVAEEVNSNAVCANENIDNTNIKPIETQSFYKVTLKDGKHLISKIVPNEAANEAEKKDIEFVAVQGVPDTEDDVKEKVKEEDDKKKPHDKSKHRSSSSLKSSSSSSSSGSSSRDKNKSSLHRDKSRHSSSSSSSKDKDRSRDKDKHDKERRKSSSSSRSSSKSKDKKENKEKQAEKDKDTLAKVQPQSIQKLPKIPKKSTEDKDKSKTLKETKKEESHKGTISIEVRKNNEERPKTVKVYKSKMRSTGLEEEAKPAPPRPTKKPVIPPVIPPIPLKRPSPVRDLGIVPPEKKSKVELTLDRPGAIKLIPPKPKPAVLQESDMFMDALAASATTKKEPKKRKRRASVSKDSSGTSPPTSPTQQSNNVTSLIGLKNMTLPKFYQDTLETKESLQENASNNSDGKENEDANKIEAAPKEEDRPLTPTDDTEETISDPPLLKNGLKSVLVLVRRKGPKKSIKWKPDEELVDVQYFELDETERVNVTKTFGDLAKMDVRGEREALQMSRKTPNEDVMDSQIPWRVLIPIEIAEPLAMPGCKSNEKNIQYAREKGVLQALYFSKKMLPDSPGEPDPENYQIKDPVIIPIDDIDNPEHDYRDKPWPQPKGSPPPQNVPNNLQPAFSANVQPITFQNFAGPPQPTFQNVQQNMPNFPAPPFMAPNVMPGTEWNNMNNMPNMHNSQMMPPNMAPPDMMNHQGGMNPNMYMPPPDNFSPMMNDNQHRFPVQFNQHQQPPNMFPPQNNFNQNRGGFGGGFRRGSGNGPWLRMNGPPPGSWNNMRGGGSHRGGRLCNNIRNKGFCRVRDTCPFFHPNN